MSTIIEGFNQLGPAGAATALAIGENASQSPQRNPTDELPENERVIQSCLKISIILISEPCR